VCFLDFRLFVSGKTTFYEREKVNTTLQIDFASAADMTEKAAGYRCIFVYKNSQKKAAILEQYIFACINMNYTYLKRVSLNVM
jgi:hypothetical protein